MKRARAELRAPMAALVLLGLLLRVMTPLPALATADRTEFEAVLCSALCLSAGLPAQDDPSPSSEVEAGAHCPLCRLPDATSAPPPPLALPGPGYWLFAVVPPVVGTRTASVHPARPPPSRAPPMAPQAA